MRIVVLSDAHGYVKPIEKAIEKSKPDVVIFCGDGASRAEDISYLYPDIKFYFVKGNCDSLVDFPVQIEEKIGSKSPIHRYHVLEPNEPSTTIIAHLYKDGNRFIHYDPTQQRSITVREAARLQSFPDDFNFVGNRGNAYQMIGNAVPPLLAEAIAKAIDELLKEVN